MLVFDKSDVKNDLNYTDFDQIYLFQCGHPTSLKFNTKFLYLHLSRNKMICEGQIW